MSIAVFIAFAGAMVAVVGTGMFFGRFIRSPRSDFAAWSAIMLVLAVALGAQAMGFALGFSGATFRAAEVAGLLLAPLWTAWGLVELAGQSVPARFAARLVTAALTVVPGVILILDPLRATAFFGKAWPGGSHYMTLPRTALTFVHVVAIGTALVVMANTAVRTRRDPAWWDVFLPAAVAGGAVLLMVSMGLTLPAAAYPLLATASAGLVWVAAKRADQLDLAALRAAQLPSAAEMSRGRRRRRPAPDTGGPGGFEGDDMPGGPFARGPEPSAGSLTGDLAGGLAGDEGPAFGTVSVPVPSSAPPSEPPTVPVPASERTGATAQGGAAVNNLFGLIAIYTLVEGSGDDFDRLAEKTVEAVSRHEPDTLLFVVHTVPNAPLQRIFYEVYRDRMAYNDHRLQPEIEDFFARQRPYVLATNVIELDLRYAKVSTLPSPSSVLEGSGLPPAPGLAGGPALPHAPGLPGDSALPPAPGLSGRDRWAMSRNERRP